MTLTEYIRKRRLSKAAEEIKRTDQKIIDIALKYQYDSPVSFSNAFKKMHGISPSNAKNNNVILKSFEKIQFNLLIDNLQEFDYRIIEMEEQEFYGVTTGIISDEDKKAIRDLYKQIKEDGTYEYIVENSNQKELYYGIYEDIIKDNEYTKKSKYYITGKAKRKDFSTIKIQKQKWACFTLTSKEQKDMLKLYKFIYGKWLPASGYTEVIGVPQLEIYYKDFCEICIAIK